MPTTYDFMSDSVALKLEKNGFWRRAATRWLYLLDRCHDRDTQETIRRRRDYCIRMSEGKVMQESAIQRPKVYVTRKEMHDSLRVHRK